MAAPSDEGADRDGEEWKYELEDLEDDADSAGESEDERLDRTIEPGDIDPENAAFVVLGAVGAVLVFLRTVAILAP